ncbi:response regulator [Pseudanabaena sp. FACHB-2040]|uniref:response regulator n=1 Tax=Pseudanabaena sp. FACHB-2040 TaxID=2692859 RepID=UPI001685CC7D|nr:response regulator [Pseudanabaena sp. FACHB-2040]MBD2256867.1 response regulator [Pseudanabaena sp. FACHB-2040]
MCNSTIPHKGLRVLVVDSDLDSRELLIALFDGYEIETVTATCVSESLEAMQNTLPDLLISEIALPIEDGYTLMRKVQAFETNHRVRIPAIALTARTGNENRAQALAAGFCRHLPKPLDIDELIAAVACITEPNQEVAASTCS